jgi:hypothetical protein
MSEMDLHGETETKTPTDPVPDDLEDLEDPEVPIADAVEQSLAVVEPEPDRETVPVDEDEYR